MLLKKYKDGGYYHHSKNGTNTFVMNDGEAAGLTTTIVQNKDGKRWMKKSYTSGDMKGETYGKVVELSTIKNGVVKKPKLLNKKESLTFAAYIPKLMELENGIKKGYNESKKVWYPHDSVEGGTKTLAYGHKLAPGENFERGIPDTYAKALLHRDVLKHRDEVARKFNEQFGEGAFENLSEGKQVLLTDYHFNGVYDDFPEFRKAIYHNDFAKMEKEYKRESDGKPLEERNKATYEFIQLLKK